MSKPNLEIIKSPEAEAFLNMVTKGFYDNSYIGLWIYEVIGREWDEMRAWAEGLKDEINPQTCTWSIGIWEWVYGFEIDNSLPLDYRRQRIMTKVLGVKPINPEAIRRGVQTLIGRTDSPIEVKDFTGPYQFSVIIRIPDDSLFTHNDIAEYITEIKPSHLRLHLEYAIASEIYTKEEIRFILLTLFWKIPFWTCRTFDGTWDFSQTTNFDGNKQFDGTWVFDGGLNFDAERGYRAKAGLKLDFGAFANVSIFDGSWDFDGNLTFDATRPGVPDIHCLAIKTGIKFIEQFKLVTGADYTGFHYKVPFWGNIFFDGSWNLDGNMNFDIGRNYDAKARLKLDLGAFTNVSLFDGTWMFDGSQRFDAVRPGLPDLHNFDIRAGIELTEKITFTEGTPYMEYHYKAPFWGNIFFDGSWLLDGNMDFGLGRDYDAMARANLDFGGFANAKSFDGTWCFYGGTLLNAEHPGVPEVHEIKLKAEAKVPEEFQASIQAKAAHALDFWQQTYLDGSKPFDGAWKFENRKRQECSNSTMETANLIAEIHESITGVSMERRRNEWYFNGRCTFKDARFFNAFYEKEDL